MYDQQNQPNSGTNGYVSNRVPSLFPGLINSVQFDQPALILKDQHRQFKADSAMLALVQPVLPLIPLVAHSVYTYYITIRQCHPPRPIRYTRNTMNNSLFPTPSAGPAEWFTAHCDGGSRGNPGPSGYGAVVEDGKSRVVAELSEFVGIQTNNFAEYSGLLAVLKWANENGTKYLRVVSDSELMVKQMQGKYAVKSPILKPLYEEARKLSRRLEGFEMRHTLRGGNKHADRLANEAMDRGMGKVALPQVGKPADFEAARQQFSKQASQLGAPGPDFRTWESMNPKQAANPAAPSPPSAAKPARQILEGYVKDGVVHLLGGELPDGIFVKIIRE